LTLVQRNGQRLLKLVNTLLDFARIEAGRAQASYEPTDLAALTADLASNFRSACERAGLRFDVECAPLSEPAYVDRDLSNLLNNAANYTPEGGAITLSARREGAMAVISVQDNGSGIATEALSRIFEMFRREEGPHSGGLGIGLTLSRRLVEMHGGSIEAKSEGKGRGSEFLVRLPLASGPPEATAPRPPPSDRAWACRSNRIE
jgi:signal transduction histidine kinase